MAFRPKPPDRRYSADLANAYGRGYALFDPQPDTAQQPPRPVEIGDVGYIKPVLGYFVRLFNIHLPPGIDGQPARDRLPDHFRPEPRGEVRNSPTRGMHLFLSDSVNIPEASAQVPVGPFFGMSAQFSASSKHGAILATPDPLISSFDSLSEERFQKYFRDNARDWDRFLAQKVAARVKLGDLLLITGVDRTTSWANAVFSNTTLKVGFGLDVQFVPGVELACRYTWNNIAAATTKFGPNLTTSNFEGASTMFPAQDITRRHHEQHPINSALDQTIFIRYIRGKSRWKHLSRRREVVNQDIEVDHPADTGMARDESMSDDTIDSDDSDGYVTADESAAGSADALDIGSSSEHEDFTDYLEPVLDHILKNSNADIALARHDDLVRLSLPDEPSDKPRIILADGVGMFSRSTVARSPALAPVVDTLVADPLSIDDNSTVAMTDDEASTTGMVPGSSTPASSVYGTETTDKSGFPTHNHHPTSTGGFPVNEYLSSGYLALSFGAEDASKLFNKFVGSQDSSTPPAGIIRYQDSSYRATASPDIILDYYSGFRLGTVVKQTMWQPSQSGDVDRHFRDATILFPIFFVIPHYHTGVEMWHARAGVTPYILDVKVSAAFGGLDTTHLCLKWPGYAQEYRKRVELKDTDRVPISTSILVERVAKFVEHFLEEAASWPIDPNAQQWRVGPDAITKDDLCIVGLVHVAASTWQPILQFEYLNYH